MECLSRNQTYRDSSIQLYDSNRPLPIRDAGRNDEIRHQRSEASQNRSWSNSPNPMQDQADTLAARSQASSEIRWGPNRSQSQGVKRTRTGNQIRYAFFINPGVIPNILQSTNIATSNCPTSHRCRNASGRRLEETPYKNAKEYGDAANI